MRSLRGLVGTAVVAGLIAGAAAATFHLLVTERLIDRAIQHEEETRRARGEAGPPPIVSRTTQKMGLVGGLLVYGAIWGVLVGLVYRLAEPKLRELTPARRGWLLAGLGGWSISVLPFLKYPANAPGVGDPQTIGYRQTLYLSFLVLSVAGTALVVGAVARLRARGVARGHAASVWLLGAGIYVPYAVVLYVAMPASPDPVRMPTQLVWGFRLLSLMGLVLFWAVLGVAFGWLAGGRSRG